MMTLHRICRTEGSVVATGIIDGLTIIEVPPALHSDVGRAGQRPGQEGGAQENALAAHRFHAFSFSFEE